MVSILKQAGTVFVEDGYVYESGTFATLSSATISIETDGYVAVSLLANYCVKELNEQSGEDNIQTGMFTAAITYYLGTPTIIDSTERNVEGGLNAASVELTVSGDDIILQITSVASERAYKGIGAFEIYATPFELGKEYIILVA